MEKQISKQKLLEYLKTAKLYEPSDGNEFRYMYCMGRNMAIDTLIAGIMIGDFDE